MRLSRLGLLGGPRSYCVLAAKLDLTVLVNATVLAAEVLEAELGEQTIGSELFDAALGLEVQVLEYSSSVDRVTLGGSSR